MSSNVSFFAQTEECLKKKMRNPPERSELVPAHILEGESCAEPSVGAAAVFFSTGCFHSGWLCSVRAESGQPRHLQLRRARLADDLNEKITKRPGPMELICKNILPIPCSIKRAIEGKRGWVGSGSGSGFSCVSFVTREEP